MVTGIDTGSPAAAASLGYRDLAYYMENVSVESAGAFCDVLVRARRATRSGSISRGRTRTGAQRTFSRT